MSTFAVLLSNMTVPINNAKGKKRINLEYVLLILAFCWHIQIAHHVLKPELFIYFFLDCQSVIRNIYLLLRESYKRNSVLVEVFGQHFPLVGVFIAALSVSFSFHSKFIAVQMLWGKFECVCHIVLFVCVLDISWYMYPLCRSCKKPSYKRVLIYSSNQKWF